MFMQVMPISSSFTTISDGGRKVGREGGWSFYVKIMLKQLNLVELELSLTVFRSDVAQEVQNCVRTYIRGHTLIFVL